MTDLKTAVDALAARSAARVVDLDRRQEQVVKWERDLAAKRAEIEAETKALAERLALVTEREAELEAKAKAVAGDCKDLATALADAGRARAEYERLTAELRAVIR